MELPADLREALQGITSMGVVTGAGVSVESGIQTYRGQGGLYDDPPDLVLIAGTTAVFPYIAETVVHAARTGRLTIEVNPEPTMLSNTVRWWLQAPAGEAVPRIAEAITSAGPD